MGSPLRGTLQGSLVPGLPSTTSLALIPSQLDLANLSSLLIMMLQARIGAPSSTPRRCMGVLSRPAGGLLAGQLAYRPAPMAAHLPKQRSSQSQMRRRAYADTELGVEESEAICSILDVRVDNAADPKYTRLTIDVRQARASLIPRSTGVVSIDSTSTSPACR